jgi:sulfite exporter TauE/SafE
MGLNIAGVLGKRGLFERAEITGSGLFRDGLRRILTIESVWGTYLLGLLLGFLPCGLLYPIFMSAAASGGFLSGVLVMAVFGASTIPALMAFGFLVSRIRPHLKATMFNVAAVLIVLLGVRTSSAAWPSTAGYRWGNSGNWLPSRLLNIVTSYQNNTLDQRLPSLYSSIHFVSFQCVSVANY